MKIVRKIIIWLVVLGILGGGGYWGWKTHQNRAREQAAKKEKSPDKLFTVKRGDLIIGVLLSGGVNTKVKHKLNLEVPVNTKLVGVVDENTFVKAGDIVARFETESLQTSIDDLKVSISNAEKDLNVAREELAILISSNAADMKVAQDNLDDAVSAYNKYRKLEGPKSKNEQDQRVSDAYQKLKDAETAHQLAREAYYNPTDVPEDEDAEEILKKAYESALKNLKSARISYRNTILDRKIFKRYTQPNNYKNARDKVARMELTLKKEHVRTQSTLAQKQNALTNAELKLRRMQRDLEQKLYYLSQMQLVAPVDGYVTFGDSDRNRWGRAEIKVGMDVYRRQVLITIPDMSWLVVDVDIPEQYRSKVRKDAPVVITPDSVQNLKISGTLSHIAPLPILLVPWDANSAKAYRSVVEFSSDDPRIVSGINVRVEIVSETLNDVLYVPVEAIFEEGGKFFVYRDESDTPHEVEVEIGKANDNYVEIKSGLDENDVVYLYRPFQQDNGE